MYFQSNIRLFLDRWLLHLPPPALFLDEFQLFLDDSGILFLDETCTTAPVSFALLAIERTCLVDFQTDMRYFQIDFQNMVGIYIEISYYNRVIKKEG